jgi:hypothetical protein
MSANPKILKLIGSLLDATTSGRVQWSESGLRDIFDLEVKGGAITISVDLEDNGEVYFIGLRGEQGKMLESEFFAPGDEGFEAARDLYRLVRRNALHVDDILDRVIADLETKK